MRARKGVKEAKAGWGDSERALEASSLGRSGHGWWSRMSGGCFGGAAAETLRCPRPPHASHLAQPLEQRGVSDRAVRQPHPKVAHHRRVGQVSLEPRDGKFLGKVGQHGVGQAEVAFSVLKVDRVDLWGRMGGRRCVPLGDVGPHIAAEVEAHHVEPLHRVEQRRDKVMRLDLGGVRVVHESERLDKPLCKCWPVGAGHGGDVGLVGAAGAGALAQDRRGLHGRHLRPQPRHHVCHLLANGRGRRRLPVRVAQHGHLGQGVGHGHQLVDDGAHGRQRHLRPRVPQHQRVRQVVDVLRRAGKVDELDRRSQLRWRRVGRGDLILQVVLNGLDVVVGGALDLLHTLRLGHVEVVRDGLQRRHGRRVEPGQLRHDGLGREPQQPGNLNGDTPLDERVLREVLPQRRRLVRVPTVDRADRRKCR
eukprot:scaffold1704_cov100-Isochrysis_galbana.AAC.1